MKFWLTQAVLGLCALATVTLNSCKKDDQVTLTPNGTPTLAASTNTVVLAQGNNQRTAVTYTWTPLGSFNWSGAEHPYEPAVTYLIELDKQGNNFAKPVSIEAGNGPTTAVSVGTLNLALNDLGVMAGTATPVEARLKAQYANNAATYSPAVALTATSFVCKAPTTDTWSIIGTAGVDWDTDINLAYDCDLQAYTLTRTLQAGVFKFRANRAWVVDYGSNAPRDAQGTAALALGGGNINVPAAGQYTIVLNLNRMTYTLSQ